MFSYVYLESLLSLFFIEEENKDYFFEYLKLGCLFLVFERSYDPRFKLTFPVHIPLSLSSLSFFRVLKGILRSKFAFLTGYGAVSSLFIYEGTFLSTDDAL
jgi:hypothetical protein